MSISALSELFSSYIYLLSIATWFQKREQREKKNKEKENDSFLTQVYC